MREIVEGVYLLEKLRGANAYLIESGNEMALVDAGMAGDVDSIASQIESAGYPLSALQAIIITHAHGDHTGGAAKLAVESGAKVMAHREEVPYIEGRESLPAGSILQSAVRWLDRLMSGGGRNVQVERALETGESLDFPGGLRVIHTPGHTPGSICLHREQDGILFCGDLLFNGNVFTGRGGLTFAPRLFSLDPEEAEKSARELSSLEIRALCMGHGEPIVMENGLRMGELLEKIDS